MATSRAKDPEQVLDSSSIDSLPGQRKSRPPGVRGDDLEQALIRNQEASIKRLDKSVALRDRALVRLNRDKDRLFLRLVQSLDDAKVLTGKIATFESRTWRSKVAKSLLASLSLAGGASTQFFDKKGADIQWVALGFSEANLFAVGLAIFVISGVLLLGLELLT